MILPHKIINHDETHEVYTNKKLSNRVERRAYCDSFRSQHILTRHITHALA